ncbi:GGDEF domain-containing protein [Lactiplantibacillus garii]|uniref:GGDEF domain-containing protein n=1 Tax=Lactiplantibacillus garii TaxID=2306423 RepID=A0A426D5R0_9LACO|nr:GGDEF domain-containing protein [Lactiplantibacillus garii]RRK09954.1 GGDEF domain-containing protein [Lactiplantibacillus garii]
MTWSNWIIAPFTTSVFFVLGVLTLYWVSVNWLLEHLHARHVKVDDEQVNSWYGLAYMLLFVFAMQAFLVGKSNSWIFMNFQLIAVTFCGYFLNLKVKYYYLYPLDLLFMIFNRSLGSWESWVHGVVLITFFTVLGILRPRLQKYSVRARFSIYMLNSTVFGGMLWLMMKLKFDLSWLTFWQEWFYLVIFEGLLYVYASMLSDNTALKQQLVKFANEDALTDTGNYAAYTAAINYQVANSSQNGLKLTMMMFDIDHFKKINDTYGHLAGDQVLKSVTETAQLVLAANDPRVKLYRTGGEEFNVIFPGYDLDASLVIVHQVFNALNHLTVTWKDQRIQLSVSVGVANLSSDDQTATAFYNRVDHNLYQSKRNGRMQVTAQ